MLSLYYDIMSIPSIQKGIANQWYYLWDPLAALIAIMDQNGNLDKYRQAKIEIHGFWVATNNNYPDCIGATILVDKKESACPTIYAKPHGSMDLYEPTPKMADDLFDELLSRIANYGSPGQARR
jgi:hypothetical protein